MPDTLSLTDNRTGKQIEAPIRDGTVRATDLRALKAADDDFGLMAYDPAFMNTASCRSAITYIDGDRGILRYRGYPIEQLAERSTFLETACLLVAGDLPTTGQLAEWQQKIAQHTLVPENIRALIGAFHHDAHPMSILLSAVGALGGFYPDSHNVFDKATRQLQIYRLLAKMPTLAAFAFRHNNGWPVVYPDDARTYPGNFLQMLFKRTDPRWVPNATLERAVDVLFILHADHEQNCSTNAMRSIGSSHADPYSAMAGAIAALYGPLHGGANEAVLHMLGEIRTLANVPAFIKRVKAGDARLMGFGHRVYKSYDPRAKIIKRVADSVFQVTGRNPLLDIALELERIALEDDYFVSRKLYPNVDFYSGLIYQAMGLPTGMFTVLFAVARTAGWLAQWEEMLADPEQKIARPRQIYTGAGPRNYVPLDERSLQAV
jgi:citrate synthase